MLKRRGIAAVFLMLGCLPHLPVRSGAAQVDTPSREFQAAVGLYNTHRYQQAAVKLEDLARRMPPSFEVEELLGLVYSAESNERQANMHFATAVRLKPKSARGRANLAVNLARLGKKDSAEAEFKKAIELSPDDYDVNHNFGEFYLHDGKIAAAIRYLENAQLARPDSDENGYDLALAYEKTGKYEAARSELNALLLRHDGAELHNLLGEIEERSGNYIAAANEFQRAAQGEPTESNIFDWGSELLIHQTLDPAVAVFSDGLNRYPNSPRLAVGLGLALYWRGSYDQAVKVLLKATDLNPSDPRAYYFLSKAYIRSPSQADAVIERFRRFRNLRPQNAQAAYYCAMSLWKGNESQGSDAHLHRVESFLMQAVALDPSYTQPHLELGNLYSQRGQFADAVPEYQRALHLDPNLPDVHYRLGQAYVHLRKMDLAQKEFQLHQQSHERDLAEEDRQRAEIRQFIYTMKGGPDGR
jgi:tetratricopeptide (TPR) repeat protein